MLDLPQWLAKRDVTHQPPVRMTDGRTKVVLTECPFCGAGKKDAAIFQDSSGMLGFKCFHDSCADKGWRDIRDEFGTPTYDEMRAMAPERNDAVRPGLPITRPYDPHWLNGHELASSTSQLTYLVEDCVVDAQPLMIGGAQKTLKTSVAMDLILSLATGTPYLGVYDVPCPLPAGFISGESGEVVIKETALAIMSAKGLQLPANSFFTFDLPSLSVEGNLERLETDIQERGLRLLVVDPAYLSLLEAGSTANPASLFTMGPILRRFAEIGTQTGCTMGLVHHTTKNDARSYGKAPELVDLSMSGFAEFARQWILMGRRRPYLPGEPHELVMNIGGSAGHSGQVAVNIQDRTEFKSRAWEVTVIDWSSEDSQADAFERRKGKIKLFLTDHGPANQTTISTSTKINGAYTRQALDALEAEDEVKNIGGRGNGQYQIVEPPITSGQSDN